MNILSWFQQLKHKKQRPTKNANTTHLTEDERRLLQQLLEKLFINDQYCEVNLSPKTGQGNKVYDIAVPYLERRHGMARNVRRSHDAALIGSTQRRKNIALNYHST